MAGHDPKPDRQDPNVEVPGDTNAADIVGRTGEEMPRQSHDGAEAETRSQPAPAAHEDDDESAGHPV